MRIEQPSVRGDVAVRSIRRAVKIMEKERVEIISIGVCGLVGVYRESWRSAIMAGAQWMESRSIKGLHRIFRPVFVRGEVDEGELKSR